MNIIHVQVETGDHLPPFGRTILVHLDEGPPVSVTRCDPYWDHVRQMARATTEERLRFIAKALADRRERPDGWRHRYLCLHIDLLVNAGHVLELMKAAGRPGATEIRDALRDARNHFGLGGRGRGAPPGNQNNRKSNRRN